MAGRSISAPVFHTIKRRADDYCACLLLMIVLSLVQAVEFKACVSASWLNCTPIWKLMYNLGQLVEALGCSKPQKTSRLGPQGCRRGPGRGVCCLATGEKEITAAKLWPMSPCSGNWGRFYDGQRQFLFESRRQLSKTPALAPGPLLLQGAVYLLTQIRDARRSLQSSARTSRQSVHGKAQLGMALLRCAGQNQRSGHCVRDLVHRIRMRMSSRKRVRPGPLIRGARAVRTGSQLFREVAPGRGFQLAWFGGECAWRN